MGNFLLVISNDLNKKNRVFANICLSGKEEMIDFNPMPFIVLFSKQGCVNRGERNGLGRREKRPKKIGRREKGRKKNREMGELA